MSFCQLFEHLRFPAVVILCAVRMYLRYPLSYQDTADLLAEREIVVDRSAVYRWVRKFGAELAKRRVKRRRWVILDWHVDETYIRIGGKWRYLFARDRPSRTDDRFPPYRAARCESLQGLSTQSHRQGPAASSGNDLHGQGADLPQGTPGREPTLRSAITHIDKKWRNNLIESDHAALKRLLGYRQSFRSLSSAKFTLCGFEAIRTIKTKHIDNMEPGVQGEIEFVHELFDLAA